MLECEEAPSDETVDRRVCPDDEAPLLCWSTVRDRFDGIVAAISGTGGGTGGLKGSWCAVEWFRCGRANVLPPPLDEGMARG